MTRLPATSLIAGAVLVLGHHTASAQAVYARRAPIDYGWWYVDRAGNGIPYSSAEAACQAAYTASRCTESYVSGSPCWNKQIEVFDHTAYCRAEAPGYAPPGPVFAFPFNGGLCPERYVMKDSIDSQSMGRYGWVYYGPNQYCQSSWPVVDRWHDKPDANPQVCGGNPIFPLTGTKRQSEALLSWSPVTPALSVAFDNRRKLPTSDPEGAFVATAAPSFGALWESSAHKRLAVQQGGSPGRYNNTHASRGAGKWVSFTRSVARPNPTPDSDVLDRMASTSSGWYYWDARAKLQESYDSTGVLKTATSVLGGKQTYLYSDSTTPASVAPVAGLLIRVEDQHGRAVRFEYEQPAGTAAPRIVRIIDPAEQAIMASYDAAGNLSRLTWPDGHARQFVYEQPETPWALTGIIDENNQRHSTYTYDAEGRARSTEYAGGVNRYSASYGTPPRWVTTETFDSANAMFWRDHHWQAPDNAVMTTPNGTDVALGATLIHGMPRVTTRSQPAGAGCEASTSTLAYDTNGNVAGRTDFNGHKSCHVHDLGRNLETSRILGLSPSADCDALAAEGTALPANSQKTSTRWHPDWPLPTAVAQGQKLTINVYHGQPDPFNGNGIASCAPAAALLPDGKPLPLLCKTVELATTDPDGRHGFALGGLPDSHATALLHLDGTGGSTTISDSGSAARPWVTAGTASLSAEQSRFGDTSFKPGTGAALTSDLKDFQFGSGEFTVEAWVYKTATPSGQRAIASLWDPDQCSWLMGSNSSNQLVFNISTNKCTTVTFLTGGTIPSSAWTHVAVTRTGNSLLFFINGALAATRTFSGTMFESAGIQMAIGAQGDLAGPWPGHIDEVRITRGKARYTAAFEVPAAPFVSPGEEVPPTPPLFDPAARARVQAWTYNEHGQVLTARDPLDNLTTYAYYGETTDNYTRGDLQSVTNAAGHATRYTRYDKVGRVLESVDANGAVTATTYTPRGWVKTVVTTPSGEAPQTTVYDYDGVGQLKKATLSDGTALEYAYDAAHRLRNIKDAAGNAVTYTLDNMGNRTGEVLKDGSGTLARNISRVYDALNRMQGATGAMK
jgi:YD repeat-containing protein